MLLVKLEHIWSWEQFIAPDPEDAAFAGISSSELKYAWEETLAKVNIHKPKWVLSFRATKDGQAEFLQWAESNIKKAFIRPSLIIVDNDADMLICKMVWG